MKMTQRIHVTAKMPSGLSLDGEFPGDVMKLARVVEKSLLAGGDVTRAAWRETRQSSHNAGCLLCSTQFEHVKVGPVMDWFHTHRCAKESSDGATESAGVSQILASERM